MFQTKKKLAAYLIKITHTSESDLNCFLMDANIEDGVNGLTLAVGFLLWSFPIDKLLRLVPDAEKRLGAHFSPKDVRSLCFGLGLLSNNFKAWTSFVGGE